MLRVFPSKPPTEGIFFAFSGKSQKSERAAIWFWAPIAKRISVALGESEIILCGMWFSLFCCVLLKK